MNKINPKDKFIAFLEASTNEQHKDELLLYRLKIQIKERDNNSCAVCKSKDYLEIHHILPLNFAPSEKYNKNNLITLCSSCHYNIAHDKNWKSYDPLWADLALEYVISL